MSLQIGPYQFQGPYSNTAQLQDAAGVYAIVNSRPDGHYVVDIGESATVKTRIETHDRSDEWANCQQGGTLNAYVLYTPGWRQSQRMQVEQQLRGQYTPPCGDR
jgi:hypothetical protein